MERPSIGWHSCTWWSSYLMVMTCPCASYPSCSGAQPHESLAWWEGKTRDEYLAYIQSAFPAEASVALQQCVGRTHSLAPFEVEAVHESQQSVKITPPQRGLHSLMEGDLDGSPIPLVEWTGFPVESGPEMFPPGVVTGKLVRLDKAGRCARVLLDACPVPGVVDEDGHPGWPPEKDACLEELPDQLAILKKVPFQRVGTIMSSFGDSPLNITDDMERVFHGDGCRISVPSLLWLHQAHGKEPDTGVKAALEALGYRLCAALPTPPNTDFVASVWTSSATDSPPVVLGRITHTCKAAMERVGQGERLRAARTVDTSSAFLDMLIDDKAFEVQPRLQGLVESWYGDNGLAGGTSSMEEHWEHWSQKVYGRSYASLPDADKAIIMTAMEGALCYGRDEQEWEQLRGPCSILFKGTPSIVKVLCDPFDPKRAGKNIRQSDRGEFTCQDRKVVVSRGGSRWAEE